MSNKGITSAGTAATKRNHMSEIKKGQKQWRHGFMTGIKRANGFEKEENVVLVDSDELFLLKREALLLEIMRMMGIFDQDSGQYWIGAEQAFTILDEMSDQCPPS